MTIILRRPFITKENKAKGCLMLHMAKTYMVTSEILREKGDEQFAELAYIGTMLWNKAAKLLGFRSIKDLDAWIKSGKEL